MTRERGRWLRAALCASALVAASALGATHARAQTVSPEYRIQSSAEGAALLMASSTRVAFDGEQYVLVWSDGRRASDALLGGPALLAARVSETGEVLDNQGVVVATQGVSVGSSVELGRAPWGSLWIDNSGRMLRLDREAQAIGEPLSVPLGTLGKSVSCSETDCLVTGTGLFELDEPQGDIVSAQRTRGVVLDACGELVVGAELDMPPGRWISAYGAEIHLLVGVEEGSVGSTGLAVPRASAVSRDGMLLWGPVALGSKEPSAAPYDRFVVAHGRGRFLVLWATRAQERWQLWATSIEPSGPSGDARVVFESSSELALGGVVWEGSGFRLAYTEGGELRSLRFDETGGVRGEAVRLPVPEGCVPAEVRLAEGGSNSLIVWSAGGSPCPGGSALLVPHAADEPSPVGFLHPRAPVDFAWFASSGDSYLAAWIEPRREAPGIYIQRRSLDGYPDAGPPALAIPLAADAKPVVSNSFVEGRYRVATEDRFVLVDPDTLSISEGDAEACGGEASTTLDLDTLAGAGGEDLPTTQRLVAFRTSRDACGVALATEQTWLHESPDFSVDERVVSAFDGERYAVVWEHWGDYTQASGVYFMSFDGDARPLLDAPRLLEGATGLPSALVWNSGTHLLVTHEYTESGDAKGLAARRLSPDGTWLDAGEGALADLQLGARIAAVVAVPDRDGWLVAWEQSRDASMNVAAARLDSEGAIAWRGLVANSPEPERLVAAVPSGGMSALVAYSRFDPAPNVAAEVVAYRVLAAEGCEPLETCAANACDVCCANGCQAPASPVECDAPRCPAACAIGERCVDGLGCLPEASVASRTSRGCGCRYASGRVGSALALCLFAVGFGCWRRRRPGRRCSTESPHACSSESPLRRKHGVRCGWRRGALVVACRAGSSPAVAGALRNFGDLRE